MIREPEQARPRWRCQTNEKPCDQLRRVRGLAHEVDFHGERALELGDDLRRMQSVRFWPVPLGEPRDRVEHVEIALDQRGDVRPQHLHDNRASIH